MSLHIKTVYSFNLCFHSQIRIIIKATIFVFVTAMLQDFTISVFVWFSVTGGVIFYNRSVDAVAELFVHIHSDLIGDSHKEVDKETALPKEKINLLEQRCSP